MVEFKSTLGFMHRKASGTCQTVSHHPVVKSVSTPFGDVPDGFTPVYFVSGGNLFVRNLEHAGGEGAVSIVGAVDSGSLELLDPFRNVGVPSNVTRLRLA